MASDFYPLSDILDVARVHPFYSDADYAPTREQIPTILENARAKADHLRLQSFPITKKDTL